MLHEILLSLSGLQSPIWSQARVRPSGEGDQETPFNQYVSPPERVMLDTLARLHDLHVQIRTTTTQLSKHHKSMVCRAVSSSVADVHLGSFLSKIIQVESAILRKDAGYVAAYEIVPLSTIVAEFSPWTRRLEWLWSVVQHLDPSAAQSARKRPPSGASILDLLEDETHTGYSDIEEMAVALLTVAQKSWMRATSLWVLYGKLPAAGNQDFCVKPNPNPSSAMDEFIIDPALAPKLLRRGAIQALLSAGSALSQLRSQATSGAAALQAFEDPSMALLQNHLTVLCSLQYPLNPTLLGSALLAINQSISENALSQILPRSLVMQLLQVILRYMLLGQGEFAVSLIRHADDRLRGRQQTLATARPIRKIGRLDDLAVKEAELNGVLAKTMAEIAALQREDDLEDDTFHLARQFLSLKAAPSEHSMRLIATLLPTPTLLRLAFPAQSPLHIFLSSDDAKIYAHINAYLLSIHRAELHLSALWRLSSHRRCHPSPLGPPRSTSQSGRARLEAGRLKDAQRNSRTRGHWTCASKLLFLVNELQAYLQGEVIQSSWTHFREWLEGKDSHHLSSARSSRPTTASSAGEPPMSEAVGRDKERVPTDPRALADAHRRYLHALNAALFLANDGFIESLKELLDQIDHLVALFSRLQTVWQGLDLQDDEGVVDAFSNYAQDEVEVLAEMDRTRSAVEASLSKIVDKIRDMEKEKETGSGVSSNIDDGMSEMNLDGTETDFVPWQARTVVDRLVMKLDGLFGRQDEDRHELIDGYDDD
ncbi:hypothetical protein A1O7_08443 [Cladophialophora yegresii CBS 114405]|uniref:Spindle pole body component n=1 Tax=Cladophialophora yegresii CBS 114405 TaxID=1182544 RepID=W9VR75_9EURO|nr:uncharacterized protein A1O7_08443 [Cladophialophora yegresii CBS 114405]EXJ55515.1 hypothetical protein A1O7_08443 [Cladophialophora yegresii CBS 114405]